MTHKLILIVDSKFAKIYRAEGLQLKNLISEYTSDELGVNHKKQSLRTGFKKQAGGMAHFFDPHNEAKDLERCDFSKKIAKIVKDILKNGDFSEIILIASQKVLNLMRKYMQKIVNIEIKEIVKDLVHSSEEQIAKVAFS
jgi:protein required for attachment to host cells